MIDAETEMRLLTDTVADTTPPLMIDAAREIVVAKLDDIKPPFTTDADLDTDAARDPAIVPPFETEPERATAS